MCRCHAGVMHCIESLVPMMQEIISASQFHIFNLLLFLKASLSPQRLDLGEAALQTINAQAFGESSDVGKNPPGTHISLEVTLCHLE